MHMHMQDADAVTDRKPRTSSSFSGVQQVRLIFEYRGERVACNLEALPCLLPSSSLGPAGCWAQHPWVVQQPARAHQGEFSIKANP